MKKFKKLNLQRERRAFRTANKVKRFSTRPRLCVYRSNKHISAQIIDDAQGVTLVSASTNEKALRDGIAFGGNCDAASKIGETIAKKALEKGITSVAFDRHGNKYHGRLRFLADAARKAGLDIGTSSDGENAPKKKVRTGAPKKKKEVQAQGPKGGKGKK